jgi:hypothetical protein
MGLSKAVGFILCRSLKHRQSVITNDLQQVLMSLFHVPPMSIGAIVKGLTTSKLTSGARMILHESIALMAFQWVSLEVQATHAMPCG